MVDVCCFMQNISGGSGWKDRGMVRMGTKKPNASVHHVAGPAKNRLENTRKRPADSVYTVILPVTFRCIFRDKRLNSTWRVCNVFAEIYNGCQKNITLTVRHRILYKRILKMQAFFAPEMKFFDKISPDGG